MLENIIKKFICRLWLEEKQTLAKVAVFGRFILTRTIRLPKFQPQILRQTTLHKTNNQLKTLPPPRPSHPQHPRLNKPDATLQKNRRINFKLDADSAARLE